MDRIFSSLRKIEILRHVLPALFFGASLGIFIHGYWLTDFFPVGSKTLLLLTLSINLVGMAGYILLFLWVTYALQGLSTLQKVGITGVSLLVGAFLLFTVTGNWQKPDRYISLFLPDHSLEISVPAGQDSGEISISWMTTSLGDTSYDTIDYKGWELQKDSLVLKNVPDNHFRWVGKTGDEVQIVFDVPSRKGNAILSWDGNQETLQFSRKKNPYVRAFNIPFYASHGWMLFLGVLNFALLSLPLCLLVWNRRVEILRSINDGFAQNSQPIHWREWIVVLALAALAFALRAPNLENLFPTVEEYSHINAAKQIIQGAPIESVYERSLWLVTLPVTLVFKIFGFQLWAARLLGVIFNVLAVIPLYLLARKINRPVAILSVLLFATSPWIIATSRVVREYAYYPFYFFWIIYGMILLLEQIPDRFRIDKDWKTLWKPGMLLLGAWLALLPYYALNLDHLSTFKTILIAYVALGVLLFLKVDIRYWKNLPVMVGIFIATIYFERYFSARATINLIPLEYFFLNPFQQWYFDRATFIPVIGLLGAMAAGILVRRTNIIPFFLLILYSGSMAFFMLSSKKFFAPRHLSTTQLWYVLLVALGLYLLWVFLQTFSSLKGKKIRILTAIVLAGMFFNVRQVLTPLASKDPYMAITEDYHDNLTDLQAFMLANVETGDVLIASRIYSRFIEWVGEPLFREVYDFHVQSTEEDVLSVVDQFDSGWIIIDNARIERAVFTPDKVFLDNDRIEYIGLFDGEHVWRWREKQK